MYLQINAELHSNLHHYVCIQILITDLNQFNHSSKNSFEIFLLEYDALYQNIKILLNITIEHIMH